MGKGPKKSIPFENSNLNPRDLLRDIVLLVGTNVSLETAFVDNISRFLQMGCIFKGT